MLIIKIEFEFDVDWSLTIHYKREGTSAALGDWPCSGVVFSTIKLGLNDLVRGPQALKIALGIPEPGHSLK